MERKFKNFGEFLKFHRAKMNLTQSELGKKLGVSVESVRCWEGQKFKPNPAKIHAIAELFNTDFDEVYTYANL